MNDDQTEVAIIGGGIAGLYAAWRLADSGKQVTLFELSDRLGGRIDTKAVPNQHCSVELGPMRFTSCMQVVSSLLRKLQIATEPFPGTPLRQMFLRGVEIPVDAGGTPKGSIPYRLATSESDNPFGLATAILNEVVPNALAVTPQEWYGVLQNTRYNGAYLWETGFWNIAEDAVSNEAYQYLAEAFGLESVLTNANAAMSIRMMSLIFNDALHNGVFRPVEGWGALAGALVKDLQRQTHCTIRVEHALQQINRGDRGALELVFSTPAGLKKVHAESVVLTLPRRPLELIDLRNLFEEGGRFQQQEEWIAKLSQVERVPAFKLALFYDSPWWQQYQESWTDGSSVTDLPVRQVFWGIGLGANTTANQQVLMASYCDSESAEFWSGLAGLGTGRALSADCEDLNSAPWQRLLTAVNGQVQQLLQASNPGIKPEAPPQPVWGRYVDWSRDPFGAAWHEWLPGVNILEAIPAMRQPLKDLPVFTCGEAYSWFQGWIEGALMAVEHTMQEHFHLSWPDWLPATADLGP